MYVIVQPATRIGRIDGDAADPNYMQRRLGFRRTVLGGLWQRMVAAFPALNAPLREARTVVELLPANGELIVDASPDLVERLQQTDWLRAFPDYPLPPLQTYNVSGPILPTDWHLTSIRKPAGLDGSGVVVGVVDTGIDLAMPDHASRAPRLRFGGFDAVTGTVINATPYDVHGHGSQVCAFLAGDSSGVSPAVYLNVASVPPDLDQFTGVRVHKGLEWLQTQPNPAGYARSLGCDIVNLSLHIGWDDEWKDDLYRPLLDLREGGQTFVVAAIGNTMGKWYCPGAYDCVCSVGALTSADAVAAFSSWGNNPDGLARPDLCAPGSDVRLATTYGVDSLFGTSFSSPIVAGAAALLIQKYPQERLRPDLIRARLLKRVRGISSAECCLTPSPAALKLMTGAGALDLGGL